jgi:hypothetical protein
VLVAAIHQHVLWHQVAVREAACSVQVPASNRAAAHTQSAHADTQTHTQKSSAPTSRRT